MEHEPKFPANDNLSEEERARLLRETETIAEIEEFSLAVKALSQEVVAVERYLNSPGYISSTGKSLYARAKDEYERLYALQDTVQDKLLGDEALLGLGTRLDSVKTRIDSMP